MQTTKSTSQAGERTQIKALPKLAEYGELIASFNDFADGEEINSGSIPMGLFAGTIKVTHDGKKHEIEVIHDSGASICLSAKGRVFRLNLEWLTDQAIKAGLLDKGPINFERDFTH